MRQGERENVYMFCDLLISVQPNSLIVWTGKESFIQFPVTSDVNLTKFMLHWSQN